MPYSLFRFFFSSNRDRNFAEIKFTVVVVFLKTVCLYLFLTCVTFQKCNWYQVDNLQRMAPPFHC